MKQIKDLKLQDLQKLQALGEQDLKNELKASEKNLFCLKAKKELGELKQTHLIKFLRRYVAQLKTIAVQKGFNIG